MDISSTDMTSIYMCQPYILGVFLMVSHVDVDVDVTFGFVEHFELEIQNVQIKKCLMCIEYILSPHKVGSRNFYYSKLDTSRRFPKHISIFTFCVYFSFVLPLSEKKKLKVRSHSIFDNLRSSTLQFNAGVTSYSVTCSNKFTLR